jgi:prophage regulatory protein
MNRKIAAESPSAPVLPEAGFMRLPQVLSLIPVGRSTWWAGVRTGRFPHPVKLGPRLTAWRVEDIRTLMTSLAGGQA